MAFYQPLMDGRAMTNVYEEHVFNVRVTFGSSSISSYKGKDVTFARSDTGEFTWTLPKPYRYITKFTSGWKRASGAPLEARITAYNLDAGTVTIKTVDTSGNAADPTSGDELFLDLGVTENNLNDGFEG